MSSTREMIQRLIKENNVMVFSKSYCPYCVKAKNLFKSLNVPFKAIELDEMGQQGAEIQSELEKITKQSTVPNIFIKEQHVGGCDSVHALHSKGKLLPML